MFQENYFAEKDGGQGKDNFFLIWIVIELTFIEFDVAVYSFWFRQITNHNIPDYYEIGGFYFRNGMGFVRFMYEGQIAYARVCGRDFLMKSSDDWLTGSLPPLQSNQEIGTYLYDWS